MTVWQRHCESTTQNPETYLHLFQLLNNLIVALAHTKQALDGISSTRQLLTQTDDLQVCVCVRDRVVVAVGCVKHQASRDCQRISRVESETAGCKQLGLSSTHMQHALTA